MDVHDVALRVEVHVPYLLQEGSPAHHFLWVQEEILEQLKLLRREVELAVVDQRDVPQAVQRDGAVPEHLESLRASAAVQRPDPSEELVELERLG